jgi:NAD(P)-dependent dehydrogenase (short-subunit alcohol dehydrogenase family)
MAFVRRDDTKERMSTQLAGKSALITGASRGIGAATALALVQAGATGLVLHYNSYREGAEETAERIRAAGADVQLIQADLGRTEGIHKLLDQVKDHSFDILINNAGHLVTRTKLVDSTEEVYDAVMNLNVKSMWFVTQAVVPSMIARKAGVIVNIGSIAARNGGGPGATIYAAAKAAVATFTKGWAKELAPHGIRVNAVSPGTVDNYFHEKHSNRQILDNVIAATPAGRLATNEDISDVILFLCSDASRYMHGQTLEVNGGMLMV